MRHQVYLKIHDFSCAHIQCDMSPTPPPALSKLKHSTSSTPTPLSLLLVQRHSSPRHLPQIHARVILTGAHQDNLIATRLIGRYPPPLALRVLAHLRRPNIFPFNAAIRVLSESALSSPSPALALFGSLKRRALAPNDLTFSFLLKACLRSPNPLHIRQIHIHVVKSGFGSDSFVANGLLTAYAKGVGDVPAARNMFDEMLDKTVLSWTCMITGYAQSGKANDALTLFSMMVGENVRPEDDTMVGVLSACSNLEFGEIEKWVDVFSAYSAGVDSLFRDSVDTVLIYLYGKWGKVEESRELFDRMLGRGSGSSSIVAWNAMIGGYVQNGRPVEALELFHRLRAGLNPKPNHVTIVSVLSACTLVGDLDLGRWAHEYVKSEGRRGVVESNRILATAFIDMYSKCGSLKEAKKVFHGMANRDIVSFNAMIMGLAMNGHGEEALGLFSEIGNLDIQPNDRTFLGLLCACTHSGLVAEGRRFFRDMHRRYLVTPKLEHYACFVDLLARAGHVEEALEVVDTMPVEPNGLVWGALLGACLVHSRVDLAPDAAKRLFNVDPENSAGYVMLSNSHASHNSWGDIADVRELMRVRGVRKQPGCSWIGIKGIIHEFQVGHIIHPQIQEVLSYLDCLTRQMRLNSQ